MGDTLALKFERLATVFKKDPEVFVVLHEFKDVDDNLVGSGIRHHSLDLSDLVQP
jgi:hypothetical protein